MDGSPMRNFCSQDGEAEILIPAMDWVVQSAFDEDFIKGPPSATAATSKMLNWEWRQLLRTEPTPRI
jgi:hypothetical protein